MYTAQFSDGTLISYIESELYLIFSLQIHLSTTLARKVTWDGPTVNDFKIINPLDFKLHIFDMRAPLQENTIDSSRRFLTDGELVTRIPVRKVIQGQPGRWTITDANLSPDNER